MDTNNKILSAALEYLSRGWSVIPVNPKDKAPLLDSWKKYQDRLPTNEEVVNWWTKWPEANIALITGKLSGINVVDIDPRHGGKFDSSITPTVFSRTGGGGWHAFYKYYLGLHCKIGLKEGVDFKTDGGYVILPPSVHSSGNEYTWHGEAYSKGEFANLPESIIQLINKLPNTGGSWKDKLEGVNEGSRNESAASIAGKLLSSFPQSQWESFCWPMLGAWNLQNNPPLNETELREVFNSISSREINKPTNNQIPDIRIPNALEFLMQDFGDTSWLIENVLPIGGSGIIVAKRESYKTWLGLYMSECVTKGVALWGIFPTVQTKVLYISNDDPAGSFRNRLEKFDFDGKLFIYHQSLPNFTVEQDNGSFKSVKELILKQKIGLVIVDIVRNTHNKDSNVDKDAKAVLDKFKELREANPELTFLFTFHPSKESQFERHLGGRKSEEAVGSYYWEAAVDTVLSLTKSTDEELNDIVAITITKDKQSEQKPKPFVGIRRNFNSPVEFIYEEKIPDKLKIQLAKEALLKLLQEQPDLSREEIIKYLTTNNICGSRNGETAIADLTREKVITHSEKKPYKYRLPNTESDSIPQNANTYIDCGIAESSMVIEQTKLSYREDEV